MNNILAILIPRAAIILGALVTGQLSNQHSSTIMKCWVRLDTAYLMHDIESIQHTVSKGNVQLSLYARSLLATLNGHFEQSVVIGKKCVDYDKKTDDEKFMHFICLLDVSRNYGYMYRMKQHYIYLYKARNYAISEEYGLERISGRKFIQDFLGTSSFLNSNPKMWPITTSNIRQDWQSIRMRSGLVEVLIDGKKVPMLVDTGSSGIMITTSDIIKYHLKGSLKLLNLGGLAHGYNKIYRTNGVYTTDSLQFGPMTIASPYITVINNKKLPKPYYSTIGINVLKKFGSFTYSARYITRSRHAVSSKCSKMSIRIPISGYAYGWGIFIPLSVSFGEGIYYLDTGVDSSYSGAALSIYKSYADYLIQSKAAKLFSPTGLRRTLTSSDGKVASIQAQFIKFNFVGDKQRKILLASILPDGYRHSNPYFFGRYGIVGRNTVRGGKFSVRLDFKANRVCINRQ